MQDKRGISAIVATVLMVLITVVAVGIIWVVILPMIKEASPLGDKDVRLEIVTDGGYTFCDASSGILSVQVKRGADESDLVNFIFLVIIGGNSVSYSTDEDGEDWVVPGPNEASVYRLNVSKFIFGACDSIDSVSVIPVFSDGEQGSPTSSPGSIIRRGSSPGDAGSPDGCTATGAEICIGGEDEDCDGDVDWDDSDCDQWVGWNILTDCGELDENGGEYILQKDVFASGDCFTINESNVELDLGGHTVTGSGGDYGVYLPTFGSAVIKNGYISNFYAGVFVWGPDNNLLTNLNISNNEIGIYLDDTSDNTLDDIYTESNSRNGIIFDGGSEFEITNSVFCDGMNWIGWETDCSGTGNTFPVVVEGACDGWPVEGTHYTAC